MDFCLALILYARYSYFKCTPITSEPIFVLGGHFISRSDFQRFIEAISKHTILNSELVEQGTFGEALNLIDEDGSSQLQYPYLSKKNFFGD